MIYRYLFESSVPVGEIENTLTLAMVGTESLHGTSVMLLDVRHLFIAEKRAVVIRADSEAGRDFARLFTGFVSQEFSLEQFQVERIPSQPSLN